MYITLESYILLPPSPSTRGGAPLFALSLCRLPLSVPPPPCLQGRLARRLIACTRWRRALKGVKQLPAGCRRTRGGYSSHGGPRKRRAELERRAASLSSTNMMDMNNDSDEDSFREGYEESSFAVASIDGLTASLPSSWPISPSGWTTLPPWWPHIHTSTSTRMGWDAPRASPRSDHC